MTGDIAFVKGADFEIQDLSWISNYTHSPKHYAFAVQIRMPRKRQLDQSITNTGLLLPSIHQTPLVQCPERTHFRINEFYQWWLERKDRNDKRPPDRVDAESEQSFNNAVSRWCLVHQRVWS